MNKKVNVAVVHTNLKIGGAEKSSLLLYNLLSEFYNVTLIVIDNKVELDIDTSVNLVHLKGHNNFLLNKFYKFFSLHNILREREIDVVLDSRTKFSLVKETMYSIVYSGFKVVYLIRSSNIDHYLGKNSFLFRLIFKNVKHYVCVSADIVYDVKKRMRTKNVSSINNYFQKNTSPKETPNIKEDYILFFGRIDNESKDLHFLVSSYAESILPSKNIKLIILGDGPDQKAIISQVNELNLNDKIIFKNSVVNPEEYITKSLFTVITSKYEGFPRAVLESLSLGIPVVATYFKSGLDELVQHEYNGLIAQKNKEQFSLGLNRMITDENLYKHCKNNAVKSVLHFNKASIGKQWEKLIQNL